MNIILNKNEVLIDFLKFTNMKIIQRNDHFNFSLDSVLLAGFCTINMSIKKILDLGTGNGAIPLILSRRSTSYITGIEIQNISAELAKKNIELNNLNERISIIHGDLKNWQDFFKPQSFDLIVSNPPFFKLDENPKQINDLKQLSLARHEISASLEDIIQTACSLLRNRGYFSMVHRSERINDIFELMKKYHIEPKRVQFCHSKQNKPSKIVLIEGIKNCSSNLTILPPLFTHNENGTYSNEVLSKFKG